MLSNCLFCYFCSTRQSKNQKTPSLLAQDNQMEKFQHPQNTSTSSSELHHCWYNMKYQICQNTEILKQFSVISTLQIETAKGAESLCAGICQDTGQHTELRDCNTIKALLSLSKSL